MEAINDVDAGMQINGVIGLQCLQMVHMFRGCSDPNTKFYLTLLGTINCSTAPVLGKSDRNPASL